MIKLFFIGFVQFGLMYVCFQGALLFLHGHEVALLMLSTPVYLVLVDGLLKKQWNIFIIFVIMSVLVLGALIADSSQKFCFQWKGVLLMQICNFSFALGQLLLKRFLSTIENLNVLTCNFLLYLGAGAVCLPLAGLTYFFLPYPVITKQTTAIAALYGIICCGIAHWLWNIGVRRVSTKILAVMNNLQIPLAIVVSWLGFREKIIWPRFVSMLMVFVIMFYLARKFDNK